MLTIVAGVAKDESEASVDRAPGEDPQGTIFISYARKDEDFVRRLSADLERAGQPTWVDQKGIRPTADWIEEVKAAITGAQAFVFVISPESARSKVCKQEIEHALEVNKRILPVVHRKVPPERLPDAIASRNWISLGGKGGRASGIKALKGAVDTDPEWAASHTRLLVRAQEWEESGRDSSLALRGQDLSGSESWLSQADDRKDPQPTRLQTDLVLESRRLATRTQRLRTIVLSVGLVVALGLAVYALVQRGQAEQRAREARSRELAATAVAQVGNNPQLGLLLALEAAETEPTDEAESSLRQTLDSSYGRGVLSGHRGPLNSAVISRDGGEAATGGEGGTLTVWDVATGTRVREIKPRAGVVTDVALSPDGRLVAASTAAGRVGLWDAATGRSVQVLRPPGGGSAESVAFSTDGKRVTAGGEDGAYVWTLGGRPLEHLRGHRGLVWSSSFSPSGASVVTAGEDGTARVWVGGRETLVLGPERGSARRPDVNSAVFSTEGDQILTASDDGQAKVWDATTGELQVLLPVSDTATYTAEFDKRGTRALTGSLDGSARIWSLPRSGSTDGAPQRGELLLTLRSPSGEVRSAAFGPDASTVITAHSDGLARIWRPGRGDVELALPHAAPHEVLDTAYSPDGEEILTAATDGRVYRWAADSGEPAGSPLKQFQPLSAEFSPDGNRIVTTGNDGSVRVWTGEGRNPRDLDSPLGEANGAAFAPKGDRVVAVGEKGDRGVGEEGGRIWDLESATGFVDLAETTGPLFGVAFSPDGKTVATVGATGQVRLWDAASGAPKGRLTGHRGSVVGVAFSPDGRTLATAGIADRTARLWDVASGEATATLSAHSAGVYAVAFSPDGQSLATSAADRTVRVWDVSSGQPLDTLRGPRDEIDAVAYRPDGRRIVAASRDGNAYILRCDICIPYEELLREARERVSRALTPEERDGYLREFE